MVGHAFYRPLPPDELAAIIHEACGDDSSTAMLTQVSDVTGCQAPRVSRFISINLDSVDADDC